MSNKLFGRTATKVLTNCFSMTIKLFDNGDSVEYQFNGGNDDTIYESEVEFIEDTEDVLGYGIQEDDRYIDGACFKAIDGNYYFLGEFLRDNK